MTKNNKAPYTEAENLLILSALKIGASSIKEIYFETKIPYMLVLEWFSYQENTQLAEKMSHEPLWEAKKKVLAQAKESSNDAKWLLTHHKDSKRDWSDRVEHTGSGGKDLIPVSAEKKEEIEKALDAMSKT